METLCLLVIESMRNVTQQWKSLSPVTLLRCRSDVVRFLFVLVNDPEAERRGKHTLPSAAVTVTVHVS